MLSRRGVLQWLLDVEEDGRHPERAVALRNGGELASLAVAEGVIAADAQQREQFARTLAQLQVDGWLAWVMYEIDRLVGSPSAGGPRPSEETASR